MADDPISSSNGTRIFIGPVNNTANDPTEYEALSWTEIEPVESISEFGDTNETVRFTALGDGRVRKAKGSADAGDVTVVVGDSPRNLGQIAAKAAAKTSYAYAFKVVLADAPDENDTDSVFYYRAKVMSARINPGAVNNAVTRSLVLAIDSEIVEVPSEAVS